MRVYAVKCTDYAAVGEALATLLDLMGGLEQFVTPGERLILKPNLLSAEHPEHATTTHPAVVAAVGRMVKHAGGAPVILDSPGGGFPHSAATLKRVYRVCGMEQAAQEAGLELCVDPAYQEVAFPAGVLLKRFEILTPVVEAAGVINLCKFKTHGFLSMTGAVKNCFGVIPGLAKPGYHAKLPDTAHFAGMCLDLAACVAPRLSIMDAVVGMEGNGPRNGTPRAVGWLLAAVNPLALDVIAAAMMGLAQADNPLLIEAAKRGLTPTRPEQVELIGATLADMRIPGYQLPSTVPSRSSWLLTTLKPILKNALTVWPQILPDKCVGCGVCRTACPMQVITIDRIAKIHHHACIRCYCCHEMCPHDAIALKQSLLYRVLHRRKPHKV